MNIHQRKLKIPTPKKLPWSEEKLPYYFIGDGAHLLREYLMKPMRGQRLTTQESNYNYRLSRARCVVENSFGRISKKWEVLQKTIQQKPENVEKVMKGICILHNILIDKNDKTLINDVKYVNEQEVQEDKQQ
uniref:DDE Tnp4 domain-containing protein n=1 Tax=Trichogramma kaykai TaxID=54128 RepID=A0ABD2WAR2_9HYME